MKFSDVKDLALIAALGAAAYVIYKAVAGVPKALTTAGENIGHTLFDVLNPTDARENYFYNVVFSNGSHSIPATSVTPNKYFIFRGAPFRMVKRADGLWHAVTAEMVAVLDDAR